MEKLPKYEDIGILQIPKGSVILFYGGNKLTELVGNKIYKHRYVPPAFHAALYAGNGVILNVGKFKTFQPLTKELISTRRVDVIIYNKLDVYKREDLVRDAMLDADKPRTGIQVSSYAITDYLRFGLRFLKPSKKDFCSENVVELLEGVGIKSSDSKAVNTAPWDLLEYALDHKDECDVKTLWVGTEFKNK